MTIRLRLTAGAAALAAGLWFLSGAAAAPILPPDTYKKAAEADVKFLQTRLDEIAKAEKPLDSKVKPAAAAKLRIAGLITPAPGRQGEAAH